MLKTLGRFALGVHSVKLDVDAESRDGFFNLSKNHIIVGLGYSRWPHVLEVLLHEAVEFSTAANKCRFVPDISTSDSADAYIFLMTHPQFSEVIGQAAEFLAAAAPIVAKEFDRVNRRRRTRKKRK